MADPKSKRKSYKETPSDEFSSESVKIIGESIGITHVPEQAMQYVAEETTYRLKEILQVLISLFANFCVLLLKFIFNCKKTKLFWGLITKTSMYKFLMFL